MRAENLETRPLPVMRHYYYGQPCYTINYDIVENDGLYSCITIELPMGAWGYNEFVSAVYNVRNAQDKTSRGKAIKRMGRTAAALVAATDLG